jgi:superoxide reductase
MGSALKTQRVVEWFLYAIIFSREKINKGKGGNLMNSMGAPKVKQFGENYQTADWKQEKHVPVIECADQVKADTIFTVQVTVGKEVAHPNTTEHHISWIGLYFLPEGEKFVHEIGRFEFSAHGESAQGPNQGPVYTNHQVTASLKTNKAGTLYATSLCNIHGLWLSQKEIKIG